MTIRNALVGDPIDQVSDHYPIQVEMEATLVDREQAPQHDSDVVDLRSLPQMTIRKVIKECVDKGLFDSILNISGHPLIDHVPPEVARHYRP